MSGRHGASTSGARTRAARELTPFSRWCTVRHTNRRAATARKLKNSLKGIVLRSTRHIERSTPSCRRHRGSLARAFSPNCGQQPSLASYEIRILSIRGTYGPTTHHYYRDHNAACLSAQVHQVGRGAAEARARRATFIAMQTPTSRFRAHARSLGMKFEGGPYGDFSYVIRSGVLVLRPP